MTREVGPQKLTADNMPNDHVHAHDLSRFEPLRKNNEGCGSAYLELNSCTPGRPEVVYINHTALRRILQFRFFLMLPTRTAWLHLCTEFPGVTQSPI